MNPYTQIQYKTHGKFKVGDRVRTLHGYGGVIGEIVEDRGPLGIKGTRIYGVKLRLDEWNEITTEYPEENLEAVLESDSPNGQPC